MTILKFEERDGVLRCQNNDINLPSIVCSMSRYKYFYGKQFKWNGKKYMFNSVKLNYYERHFDEIEMFDVEVFVKITTKKIFEKIKIKSRRSEHEERFGPQALFNIFKREYEKKGIPLIISNEKACVNKFRTKIMDNFYEAGFGDSAMINYVRRCVTFGNYRGDCIYLEWVFHDRTLQNYLLVLNGDKDITAVWQYLDITLSNIEKKKIKYLMNLRHWDDFTEIEKLLCLKLYKRYDIKHYGQLKEKVREKNVQTKREIFEILCEEYDMNIGEMLRYTKHKALYLEYEYTKNQISEAMK